MNILKTQPATVGAVAAAVFAVAQGAWLAFHDHSQPFDPQVVVALIAALYQAGWIHPNVTPLARPRDATGRKLYPAGVRVKTPPREPQ